MWLYGFGGLGSVPGLSQAFIEPQSPPSSWETRLCGRAPWGFSTQSRRKRSRPAGMSWKEVGKGLPRVGKSITNKEGREPRGRASLGKP